MVNYLITSERVHEKFTKLTCIRRAPPTGSSFFFYSIDSVVTPSGLLLTRESLYLHYRESQTVITMFQCCNMKYSDIRGKDVIDSKGEKIGDIIDCIVDISENKLALKYLVLGGGMIEELAEMERENVTH